MTSDVRQLLGIFLDAKIAQCTPYDEGPDEPYLDPETPTSWPNGPDSFFPWRSPGDEAAAFQDLDIGGGYEVCLRRTEAKVKHDGHLDKYTWAIHLLGQSEDKRVIDLDWLAETDFRARNIELLFNTKSELEDRRWVLTLLKISLEKGCTVHARHSEIQQGIHQIEYDVEGTMTPEVLTVFDSQIRRKTVRLRLRETLD